jgi:hypothetical protein
MPGILVQCLEHSSLDSNGSSQGSWKRMFPKKKAPAAGATAILLER